MKSITAAILSALIVLSCLGVFAGAAWDGSSKADYSGKLFIVYPFYGNAV